MPALVSRALPIAIILLSWSLPLHAADNPLPAPNSDSTYQQLRNLTLAGEAASVNNFELERKSLKLLTKEDEFSEAFSQAVLRFTDSTYEEIKKGGSAAAGGCDAGLLKDTRSEER